MFFLNPTYLWALLGLLVPIAIHLWSKKEGKTIKIGSIQLLSEARSKQNNNIKLNELLLLLIRTLIIALVVLIMAEPQIKKNLENTELTYLVEPSLLKNKTITRLLDTISTEASFRLLQKGFPELDINDTPNPNATTPNYWQLAQEMDKLQTDSIIVFTNGLLKGLKGKRPEVSANIEWIVIDDGETLENAIKATKKDGTIEIISSVSNSQNVSFKKETLPSNSNKFAINKAQDSIKINNEWLLVEKTKPLNVLIFNDKDFNKESRYINASFKTISKYVNTPINITIKKDTTDLMADDYDCIVWLSKQQPLEVSGILLVYNPDYFASSLVVESQTENLYYLTKTLDSESIIDEHLPEQLIRMLGFHSDLTKTILENDKRVVAKEALQPIFKDIELQKSHASILDISKWLWLFLASLFVLERIVSNYRKQ